MIRQVLTALVLTALVVASAAAALGVPSSQAPSPDAPRTKSIGQLIFEQQAHFAAQHADHPEEMALPPVDKVAEARRILRDEPVLGATPLGWVESGKTDRLLGLRPGSDAASLQRDLVTEVLRVHALAGVPVAPAEVLSLRAQADALPAEVRGPFADLVGATADAYAAQLGVAQAIAARGLKQPTEHDTVLTLAERDATVANAESVLAAANVLRVAIEDLGPRATLPPFSDSEGLVILGSTGPNTYTRGGLVLDPVLVVEQGGDDVYANSGAGACPLPLTIGNVACNKLALSFILDLAGSDVYTYDGMPSVIQGSGIYGGIGILVDMAGADSYSSKMTRSNGLPLFQYIDGVAQGSGEGGYGLLLDVEGNDTYRADVRSTNGWDIWDFAQGFGSAGGVGLLVDGSGSDQYLSNGLGLTGSGFQGVYTNGVGFYGGVGIQIDEGQDGDVYHATNVAETVDYYAQGFAAFGALGILYDEGGNDDYDATQEATDSWIVPLLNCAFGTGSFGGVGILIDLAGDDRYYGDSKSKYAAHTMNEGFGGPGVAYGLFVDVSGDDGHFMEVHGGSGSKTMGRGVIVNNGTIAGNLFGTYLDLGGNDQYTGAWPSRDNHVWVLGADVNLLMTAEDFLYGA